MALDGFGAGFGAVGFGAFRTKRPATYTFPPDVPVKYLGSPAFSASVLDATDEAGFTASPALGFGATIAGAVGFVASPALGFGATIAGAVGFVASPASPFKAVPPPKLAPLKIDALDVGKAGEELTNPLAGNSGRNEESNPNEESSKPPEVVKSDPLTLLIGVVFDPLNPPDEPPAEPPKEDDSPPADKPAPKESSPLESLVGSPSPNDSPLD